MILMNQKTFQEIENFVATPVVEHRLRRCSLVFPMPLVFDMLGFKLPLMYLVSVSQGPDGTNSASMFSSNNPHVFFDYVLADVSAGSHSYQHKLSQRSFHETFLLDPPADAMPFRETPHASPPLRLHILDLRAKLGNMIVDVLNVGSEFSYEETAALRTVIRDRDRLKVFMEYAVDPEIKKLYVESEYKLEPQVEVDPSIFLEAAGP